MSMDIVTLGIRVDASGAIQGLRNFEDAAARAGKQASVLDGAAAKLRTGMTALGAGFGAVAALQKFVQESVAAQNVTAQLEARLRALEGVTDQSAMALAMHAEALRGVSTQTDDAIKSAQTLLLQFDRIQGETFPKATQAALDLSAAMGIDLRSAAMAVGKALQEPVEGIAALRRQGVMLADDQERLIKRLVETGEAAKAQDIVLGQLEQKFHGAAKAARDTLGGALGAVKDRFGELFEMDRTQAAPLIDVLDFLANRLADLKVMLPQMMSLGLGIAGTSGSQASGSFGTDPILNPALAQAVATYTRATEEARRRSDEAVQSMRDLAQSYRDKSAATQREIEYTGAHTEALVRQIEKERELADLRNAIEDAATNRDSQKRLNAAFAGRATPAFDPAFSEGLGQLPGVSNELAKQAYAKYVAFKSEQDQRYAAGYLAQEERSQAEVNQLRENYLRQWQQTVANGISRMLTDGLQSWKNFFDALGQMAAQSIGDIISRQVGKLSDPMKNAIGAGAFGGSFGYQSQSPLKGALGGAAAGFAVGGPIGAVVGGLSGLVGGRFGASEAAQKAAEENRRLAAAYKLAAEAAAREAQAKRDALAFDESMAKSDLRVRSLRASGMTAEAEALALWNRQVEEFSAAVKKGFSDEYLAMLAQIQEQERQMLVANQAAEAARALADAQAEQARTAREAAEIIAEAQRQAAEAAVMWGMKTEDLAIRLLRATDKTAEADRKAFELAQKRERREIESQEMEHMQKLSTASKLIALANANWIGQDPKWRAEQESIIALAQAQLDAIAKYKELLDEVQRAELEQFLGGQSGTLMPGASAAAPGTAGSFNTVISRTTAVQGDRMVDELVRHSNFLVLGAQLQSAQSLAGSSLVS
jgi:hypothetical protein